MVAVAVQEKDGKIVSFRSFMRNPVRDFVGQNPPFNSKRAFVDPYLEYPAYVLEAANDCNLHFALEYTSNKKSKSDFLSILYSL